MNRLIKNAAAFGFLILFLPYTMTLLMNGRQGIHREEELSSLEYQVLSCLMSEDYSWMEDETLELMAVLYRTECVRTGEQGKTEVRAELYEQNYDRMYDAAAKTEGQVIKVEGEYKELPYHAVSGGRTRDGVLLGAEYAYVLAADCPDDKESEDYLQICRTSREELGQMLDTELPEHFLEDMVIERDGADYVSRVVIGDQEWQGEAFRSLLHLPSSSFRLEQDAAEDEIRITVKGSGHGFGISLYTADRMIRDGAELEEVIQKFYQDAVCITIP